MSNTKIYIKSILIPLIAGGAVGFIILLIMKLYKSHF